jgi:cell division transport system permease protein
MLQPTSHQKRIGSYPQLSVITTVTITIVLIGIFALFALYANKLTDLLRSSMAIQVYLQKNISKEDSIVIREKIINQPYIIRKNNIPQFAYTTSEEAAKQMIAETGEDFVSFLGENPLHDSYSLQIQEKFYNKSQLKLIKQELETINGVFDVAYTEAFVDDLQDNIKKIGGFILLAATITLIIVVSIINNTIRLALYSQRFLIRSMQLVGATAFFIKKPFLWRAAIQGLWGGFWASILLSLLLVFGYSQIPELNILYDWLQIILLYACLALGGIVICSLSAYVAITKYLNMSLDELNY